MSEGGAHGPRSDFARARTAPPHSGPDPAEPLSVREVALAAAGCLALSLVFFAPIFHDLENWGIGDWDQHAFYHEAGRVSLLEYGQVPEWNPYYCGGTDLLANPQSRVLAPTYPIVLILGTVLGLKLEILLFAGLGSLGLYCLGRQLGLDRLVAWLVPAPYFLSSLYALPTSTGMTWFMSVAYLPWACLFHERSAGAPRFLVGTGACLAFMYLSGGVYPVVIAFVFFGLLGLLRVREQGLSRSGASLAALAVLTLALGAVKFAPSIEFMSEFPRKLDRPSGFSLQSLSVGLFSRDQRHGVNVSHFDGNHFDEPDRLWRGISTDYDDVGMYIGPAVGLLFVGGLVARGRRHWDLVVCMAILLWISLGERPGWSLFSVLHELPVFESMRYSERFRLVWLMLLCLFAGFGLQALRAQLARRLSAGVASALVAALLGAVVIDFYLVTRPILEKAFIIPPLAVPRSAEFQQIRWLETYDANGFRARPSYGVYESLSGHYPALKANLGVVRCYETAFVPRRAVPRSHRAYRGEVFLRETQGQVSTLHWSPNRLRYAVRVESPGWLVVNQNHYASWRAHDGRPVENRGGRLAVAVEPGDEVIELRYQRRSLVAGAVVSAGSWLGLLAWWAARRRGREGS